MHNNNSDPKEHKNQRTRILIFLANWASEMFSQSEFEENLQLIHTLKECYLCSDWADNKQERVDVLMLFKGLESLFEGLEGHQHEDFKALDLWLLKQTA